MKIKVRAFASFREILGKEIEMELKEGSTVRDLLEALASYSPKLEEAAYDDSGDLKDYVLLMINRKRIDPSDPEAYLKAELKDGDEVAIFPPVAGG
jgi:molybdopterin synthase sulfur carrier subunit